MDCSKCFKELLTDAEKIKCPRCGAWGPLADVRKVIGSNGGPAFPRPTSDTPGQVGMSLRDWFAGMALQGLIIKSDCITENVLNAYDYADDMLKARNKDSE